MIEINEEKTILLTRGDTVSFSVTCDIENELYTFKMGEIITFNVFEKKNCDNVVLSKSVAVAEDTQEVIITLDENETRIGDIINKPVDYWYEIELTDISGNEQTILGYDEDGAKILKLYPEGKEVSSPPVRPEEIPVVDTNLDVTSHRPVENQVIARKILAIEKDLSEAKRVVSILEDDILDLDISVNGRITTWLPIEDFTYNGNTLGVKRYYDIIAESLNLEVIKLSSITFGYAQNGDPNQILHKVEEIPGPDWDVAPRIITIAGSSFDFDQYESEEELGNWNDQFDESKDHNNPNTYCACVNKVIDTVFEKAPSAVLGIISPLPTEQYYPGKIEDFDVVNLLAEKLKDICYHRAIPFLDMTHSSGIRPWSENYDTEELTRIITSRIKEFVRSIRPEF